MAKAAPELREALEASARRGGEGWNRKHPAERFYAFGLYTTPDGEYFVPTISGEDGLTRAARRYVKDKSYPTVEQARAGLRWSFADSPYHARGERYAGGVDRAIDARPSPFDLPGRAGDREVKARIDAAVEALRSLDARGLFGRGARRKSLVLVVEAGDRDPQWAMALARRLNPADVYRAYATQFATRKVGRFTELGSKKVYETRRLALSRDGRRLLASCEYDVFLFDPKAKTQLWTRPVRRGESLGVHGAALDADGDAAAVGWAGLDLHPQYGLTLWRGRDWKESVEVRLGAEPLDIAMHPAGQWVAAGMQDNRIGVFGPDGKSIQVLKAHREWPRGLAVSADGNLLASADPRGGAILWDTRRWAPLKRLKRPADTVSFDARGKRLATALRYPDDDDDPAGQVATVWDVAAGTVVKELRAPGWRIRAAVLSPDGKRCACALTRAGDVAQEKAALLDVAGGTTLAELAADFEDVNDFAFLPDGTIALAVTGHHRKPLILWRPAT
jgi:hypothetical protein